MIDKNNYNSWNKIKQNIVFWKKHIKYPKPWEVWNIYNGINIWYESLGKWKYFERPFLVIKRLWNMFLCISMTTQWKDNSPFYYKISENYFNKKSYLTLSQWKCIDNKRFIKKIWELTKSDLFEIKKELKSFWF
jgi:mRNA-degrading endonuclease toxin of MazEF toxin-antitoxin module